LGITFGGFRKEIDMKSRSNIRKKKRKQNIVLNSLIGVVIALILIVGGNMMIFSSNATTEHQQDSTTDEGESNSQDNNTQVTEDEKAEQKSETAIANQKERKTQQDEDENGDQKDQEDNESQQEENEANSDGVGEPIGTSQTGSHTSSYVEGSVDCNEKVKAIQMATGLDDSMIIWRLENGGSPQKSVGKVSPEGEQDWMYVVNLQWVDQEGWKVTSVNKQSR